jgi:hypothetical protein
VPNLRQSQKGRPGGIRLSLLFFWAKAMNRNLEMNKRFMARWPTFTAASEEIGIDNTALSHLATNKARLSKKQRQKLRNFFTDYEINKMFGGPRSKTFVPTMSQNANGRKNP